MTERCGIVLAGGACTRLYPATLAVSKQLLPVYDKPMVYYPISTLMLAGIRDIAIVTTPRDRPLFQALLSDGRQWGLRFEYLVQPSPDGLAQAYLLAESFLAGRSSAMVLGDNLFFGQGLQPLLRDVCGRGGGATVFGYRVADPRRYGVIGFDEEGRVASIVEKPERPASSQVVTGLYFLDGSAPRRAREVRPSARGELEITSLLQSYLAEGALTVEPLGRGFAWLDTGTPESLLDAGNFVRTLEKRQGLQTGSPDEIAYEQGWIDACGLRERAAVSASADYGRYLQSLVPATDA